MRGIGLGVVLLAACATAPAPPPATAAAAILEPPGSGPDIERYLADSGLVYVTVVPERRWMLAFAGQQLPRLVVYVVRGGEFTVVMGKLFTVADDTGLEFYRALARKNYEFDQLKLSVARDGGVYASFEVPTRLVDRRELLENIFGLAGAIDAVLPELARVARPVDGDLPEEDDESPVEPQPLPRLPEGALIEALRLSLDGLPIGRP
jgi:hypothetical protein